MTDVRTCEQCGSRFEPRREHARFCSADCRIAWNKAHQVHHAPGPSTLSWAVSAMADTAERIPGVAQLDQARAFAVISEAVWWVTIVDANLVRYHPDDYDNELEARCDGDRRRIDDTLAGLRFVRNQLGYGLEHGDLIQAAGGPGEASGAAGSGDTRVWIWNSLAEPPDDLQSPRGRSWELARHRAYQARLAGRPVDETFATAAAFLTTVADALNQAESAHAAD